MSKPFQIAADRWWRFDRYEIREGFIQPAPGAKLKPYNPWKSFRSASARGRAEEPPYASLVKLVEGLRQDRPTEFVRRAGRIVSFGPQVEPWKSSPAAHQTITAWCAKHGLLGLLLQRCRSVTTDYRISRASKVPTAFTRIYYYANNRWNSGGRSFEASELRLEGSGTEVPAGAIPGSWPQPGALMRSHATTSHDIELSNDPLWHWQPLDESWARFFPTLQGASGISTDFPQPGSAKFWQLYAEPVDEFLATASLLVDAAAAAIAHKRKGTKRRDPDRFASLNDLAERCSIRLHGAAARQIEQRWVCPSLISMFAVMMLRDETEDGMKNLRCKECGLLFVSGGYQAAYCSKRCRNTRGQRRYRLGQATKRMKAKL